MAHFAYLAVDQAGKRQRGSMQASNLPELETHLAQMGFDLITARSQPARRLQHSQHKVSQQERITFCFHMEQLLNAGVPLLDGLIDLRDSLPQSGLRPVVADLLRQIQGGQKLSEAMASHSKVFNEVTVSLIAAGESSGQLAEVFSKLTTTLKWEDELVARSKKLLSYPLFAATIVIGVSLFLLIYLVPQLATFIKNMNHGQLPWQTALMLQLSEFIRQRWLWLLATPFALFLLVSSYAYSGERARYRLDSLYLRLWAIGPITHKIIIARFAGFFALMYAAGVNVLDCMEIGERIVGNRVIARALHQVREAIVAGQGITESFQQTGMFSPLVIRMIKIGESTGQLDIALTNVNYFYDREVKEAIEQVQTLIEPAMTLVLGLMLGSIMLAVLGPIYDLISQLKY